jgi:hypothetical protein
MNLRMDWLTVGHAVAVLLSSAVTEAVKEPPLKEADHPGIELRDESVPPAKCPSKGCPGSNV